MDSLRSRFAAGRRPAVLAVAAGLAVLVLAGAVLVAAGQASGSTAEHPSVRIEPSTPAPAPTPVLVHVSGAVRSPGLVSLPAGARVVDALAAAGGATAAADQAAVNLAARLVDGQQVVVPKRGAAPAPAPSGGAAADAAPVSLSTATSEQLQTLPRIGPALAARIIAYRTAHGGFSSVDDLGDVGGIGPKTLAGLRDLVVP